MLAAVSKLMISASYASLICTQSSGSLHFCIVILDKVMLPEDVWTNILQINHVDSPNLLQMEYKCKNVT